MPQTVDINRQIVLAERPKGQPDKNTLQMATTEIPQPSAGEMLVRTVYLSLDPYMRGRMNDAKSYAEPVAIGGVMTAQVVGQVVTSNLDGYEAGDYVLSGSGWQDYAISDGAQVINLGKNPENPSWTLGILGMPGYTAYAGLLKIGEPKPGETVVVAAATGPVGATVGQIAKLKGCRAVGIARGGKNVLMSLKTLALMPVLIIGLMIWPLNYARPVRAGSTSISKMLVAKCFMACCHCSIRLLECPYAAWWLGTTCRACQRDQIWAQL